MTSYLRNNGDVTNFLLPLCRICVEYIKLGTCAKFDDHQRNNNKVIIGRGWGGGGGGGEDVGFMTDCSKNTMSNRVNGARFCYDF